MKIIKTKEFARLARKCGLKEDDLVEAVERAERGSIDANIGLHLVKQRIARPGSGRAGGYRAILFYQKGDQAIFLHLFEKSSRANLTAHESRSYQAFAKILATLTDEQRNDLATKRGWKEVEYGKKKGDAP
jgi:hypothetical protein